MIGVVVVDDDFRVARIHASIVDGVPGFRCVGIAHTASDARQQVREQGPDLVLLDNYLPDMAGIELARALTCDVIMVTAEANPRLVRAAFGAGALGYVIKPFAPQQLTDRLSAYAKYRALLSGIGDISQDVLDRALRALHGAPSVKPAKKGESSVTARLVVEALETAEGPLSANELAERLGIGRTTIQRYLSSLVEQGVAGMRLRYGSTGRPEHEYVRTRA